jgi:hypothetical protein
MSGNGINVDRDTRHLHRRLDAGGAGGALTAPAIAMSEHPWK